MKIKHLYVIGFLLALLLAYLNGNGRLCRELLKNGGALSAVNKNGISIFNAEVASKKLLFSLLGNNYSFHESIANKITHDINQTVFVMTSFRPLAGDHCLTTHWSNLFVFPHLIVFLDLLNAEPPWSDGSFCHECSIKFSVTNRKHHWYAFFF